MSPPNGGSFEDYSRKNEVTPVSERAFGLVFCLFFYAIGLWPLSAGRDLRWWALSVACGFLAVALVRPTLLRPLNRIWLRFGLLLHRIVSPAVLGLIFYLTITPIALVMRLLGKDPLRLRFERSAETYWIDRRPADSDPQAMRRQF